MSCCTALHAARSIFFLKPNRDYVTGHTMARPNKQTRHITVNDVAYSWRASGNDGYISLTIWPNTSDGPAIATNFSYHENLVRRADSCSSFPTRQIVITNRIVRRVILLAISQFEYNSSIKGQLVHIPRVDQLIDIGDAIRASP